MFPEISSPINGESITRRPLKRREKLAHICRLAPPLWVLGESIYGCEGVRVTMATPNSSATPKCVSPKPRLHDADSMDGVTVGTALTLTTGFSLTFSTFPEWIDLSRSLFSVHVHKRVRTQSTHSDDPTVTVRDLRFGVISVSQSQRSVLCVKCE